MLGTALAPKLGFANNHAKMAPMFANRSEAALSLANALSAYKGQNPLVLAIPRGGVPLAKIIADALHGDLDVVLVHKLGYPGNPEYAFGAIDEEGNVYVEDEADRVRSVEEAQLSGLKSLRKQYTPLKERIDPKGRTVIIVDDGVATGWTVKAATAMVARANAKRIIVATPVGPKDTMQELRADPRIDELICLESPSRFSSVGEFYKDFSQVLDDEVARILALTK